MTKTAKKKLIRVEGQNNNSSDNYRNTSMKFSLVTLKGDKRKQVLSGYTCREQFCHGIKDKIDQVDMERTRLLIIQDPSDFTVFRDKLFTGKRMINAYEREAGWTPISKITTVKHSVYPNAWLLTGPGEWMRAPQLMSILTFFLRLSSVHGPFQTDTVAEAEKTMKSLMASMKKGKLTTPSTDLSHYMPKIWDSLSLIICNHEKIFGSSNPKLNWKDEGTSTSGGFGYSSGILNFVTNQPDYSKEVVAARRRFTELRRKTKK